MITDQDGDIVDRLSPDEVEKMARRADYTDPTAFFGAGAGGKSHATANAAARLTGRRYVARRPGAAPMRGGPAEAITAFFNGRDAMRRRKPGRSKRKRAEARNR